MIKLKKTIIVFLEYNDNVTWFGRELLSDGKILFASHDTVNIESPEEREPDYNEIIIVEYSENSIYEDAIEKLEEKKPLLKNCRVWLIRPYPQSQIDKMNKGKKESATSETESSKRIDIEKFPSVIKRLFSRDTSQPYINLYINKYRDLAVYPDDYKGERKRTGLQAYMAYGNHAQKYQGGVRATTYLAASFKKTIISDKNESWDSVVLARYPTLEDFKKMLTTLRFGSHGVHRKAGLEKTMVFGTFPYEEFT